MKIIELWSKYGFEICVGIAIFVILIVALIRIGEKGTWSSSIDRLTTSSSTKSVKGGSKDSKGETECRRVVENMFNKPFKKIRPNILSNPITGNNNLEIDCYNDDLKIGIEYNGIQHYKYSPFFHKNKEAFYNQKYRDYMKRDLCEKNGILLIEVPYTVQVEDIENFLIEKLQHRLK